MVRQARLKAPTGQLNAALPVAGSDGGARGGRQEERGAGRSRKHIRDDDDDDNDDDDDDKENEDSSLSQRSSPAAAEKSSRRSAFDACMDDGQSSVFSDASSVNLSVSTDVVRPPKKIARREQVSRFRSLLAC
jgi:hypothetical protein